MKKFTTSYWIAALSIIAIISSCKDDKETITDSSIPEIEFISHDEDAQVWNEIIIQTRVIDENPIEKVEFYVNGSLIETVSVEPFDFILNTKDYSDGNLAVKAIAYNKLGGKSEKFISLDVLNTLMRFSVPGNRIAEGNEIWIFLSDDQGNVLINKQLKNGETTEFVRPDGFEGETFTKNMAFFYDFSSGNKYMFIESYNGILTGFTGGFTELATRNSGLITLNFDDLSMNEEILVSSGNNYANLKYNETCIDCGFFIYLRDVPANVLVSYKATDAIPSYTFLEDVQDQEIFNLTTNSFTPMVGEMIVVPSGYDSGSISVAGIKDPLENVKGWFDLYSTSFGSSSSEIELFYPEIEFEGFYISQNFSKGDRTYNTQKVSEVIQSNELPPFEFSINSKTSRIMGVTTQGDFDIYKATWSYEDDSHFVDHYVLGKLNGNTAEIIRPVLPAELLEKVPNLQDENLTPDHFSLVEYDKFDDYSEYLEYFFNRNLDKSYNTFESSRVSEYFVDQNMGGRLTRKDRASIERIHDRE